MVRNLDVYVEINGTPIAREWWPKVRPLQGAHVVITPVLHGGGDGGGKQVLRIVAVIALSILAPGIGAGIAGALGVTSSFGVAAITAGVYAVGSLAINALIPPSLPSTGGGGQTYDPAHQITGSRNQASPFGAVPRVYGTHRIFPVLAAQPITEVIGNEQYLRQLFCFGYRPLSLSEIKIGDTPIEAYEDYDLELNTGVQNDDITLFTNATFEEVLSLVYESNGDTYTRTSNDEAIEIQLDFNAPGGLIVIQDDGDRRTRKLYFRVEFAESGTGNWVNLRDHGNFTLSGNISLWGDSAGFRFYGRTTNPLRFGIRFTLDEGEYDVRVVRAAGRTPVTKNVSSTIVWNALRTVTANPVTLDTEKFVFAALRLRATGQLNGIVDRFNAVATSHIEDWDGAAWTEQATSNPASIYRDILIGSANARALESSRLDDSALQAWHAECEADGRSFNAVIDGRTTVFDLLKKVAAAGRGAFGMLDGQYTVIRDLEQSTPRQHFTNRNIRNLKGARSFGTIPHGFTAQFVNPDADWQQDEVTVYRDGYDENNATLLETLQLEGITDPDHAYKLALYHLSVAVLRPEQYTFEADIEHLVVTRGDLALLTHDAILVGQASGRITSVDGDNLGIDVDQELTFEGGSPTKTYAMRIRTDTNATVIPDLSSFTGTTTHVDFDSPVTGVKAGDLFLFGESGSETIEVLVHKILPGSDMSATVVCVPASQELHTALDSAVIPEFSSQVTGPLDPANVAPQQPSIDFVVSDESVLLAASDGSLITRMLVGWSQSNFDRTAIASWEVQWRGYAEDDDGNLVATNWNQAGPFTFDTTDTFITSVDDGNYYDVRVRAVSPGGVPSDWAYEYQHKVIGKTSPPPNVDSLYKSGNRLEWSYASPPIDFKGFRVKFHRGTSTDWATATLLHQGFVTENFFDITDAPTGQVTFLVKAVDTSGIESASARTVTTSLGDRVVRNILESVDHVADGYPGSIVEGSLTGSPTELCGAAFDDFWDADADTFWAADSTKFWYYTFGGVWYEFSVTPGANVAGDGTRLIFDPTATAGSLVVEWDAGTEFWGDNADAFWADDTPAFWSENWQTWPGVINGVEDKAYTFRLYVEGGDTQVCLNYVTVIFDVPDIEETFDDVSISAGGTRLSLTKTFNVIKIVSLTLQDDAGTAESVKIIDKDADLGPMVKVYDSTQTATTGVVDAIIQGY